MFVYLDFMIKSILQKISAFTLALLLLVTSTGFSMDMHYCQDQLKGISFIGEAENCHQAAAKTKKSCHHKSENKEDSEQKNCCENETLVIEKSDIDATSPQSIDIKDIQLDFVLAYVSTFVLNNQAESDFQPFELYKPPLPEIDIQVLFQTFLI